MAGGRKRAFDKTKALDAAMRVFWQKGYLGASLSDLTEGMGINKPSMYAAFGNKEALFLQATDHYLENHATKHLSCLKENQPLRKRLRNYLRSVVSEQFTDNYPKGCYISLCVSEAASDCMPDDARTLIEKVGQNTFLMLTAFFQEDEEAIKLGLHKTSNDHALMMITVLHGTASMARAGKSFEEMAPVIEGTVNTIVPL